MFRPTNRQILELCRQIETKCSELYRFFAKVHESNPELKKLWLKTADEEDNHALQFQTALRMLNDLVEKLRVDGQRVQSALEFIQKVLDEAKTAAPSPKKALEQAIQLEETLADLHMHQAGEFKNEADQQMFKAMMAADRQHLELLRQSMIDIGGPELDS